MSTTGADEESTGEVKSVDDLPAVIGDASESELAALEGTAISGYIPGSDRRAHRGDVAHDPIGFGETARVVATGYTVRGEYWSDRESGAHREARVIAVAHPSNLPVMTILARDAVPHARGGDHTIPLPGGKQDVSVVDATLRQGSVMMVELADVRSVDRSIACCSPKISWSTTNTSEH